MQLTNGTLLHGGTYKIEKVLGQGSFGITYLAEHVHLGRKVAIKEFFMKELNSRAEDGSITGLSDGSLPYNYAQKFRKEALNLSRLDHPNIVRVTDSFEDNGTFYYVMDFIDGMNLNDYIKSNSPSEQTAVEIIKEVANALEYMHEEMQMLHLDLKPGNVMRRNSDGHIFLIDFGLSKHYDVNGAPETSTTIGLGTAGYAPVEQANQAKNGDFRPTIDVYSLGATLYKLLTHDTPPAASELVSDDELLPEKMKEKNISQPLIDFVVKAMLPNVRKRIQTISEFKELLPVVDKASAFSIGAAIANGAEAVTADEEEINEVNNSEETEVIGNSEETELLTNKAIQGNEADYEKFEEKQYSIPSSYISNIDDTLQNASSGNVGAMLALGFMYLRGQGVTQNSDTAYSWFTRANYYGDYRARKMVAEWLQIKDRYVPKSATNSSTTTNISSNNNHKNKSHTGIIVACVSLLLIIGGIFLFLSRNSSEEHTPELVTNSFDQSTIDPKIMVELDSVVMEMSTMPPITNITERLSSLKGKNYPQSLVNLKSVANEVNKEDKRYLYEGMLYVDKSVCENFGLNTDDYYKMIPPDSIEMLSKDHYIRCKEDGNINHYWEMYAGAIIETLYLYSKNPSFIETLNDKEASDLTYRLAIVNIALDDLAYYDDNIKMLSETIKPLLEINAVSVEQLWNQLMKVSPQLETVRMSLIKTEQKNAHEIKE